MSSELKLDNSKEVFKLDKDILSFKINIENLSEQEPIKSNIKSQNEIKITNLTDDYLAFRTKATKKAYYDVSPTYFIIPPKEIKTIIISYFLKEGEIPKFNGHKFRFEAFVIQGNEKDKEAKALFNDYATKGQPVVGNFKKTFVQFMNGEEIKGENNQDKSHLQLPNRISHVRNASDLSEYLDIDENNEEKKDLLMDQIKSKDEQKATLSDILSGGKSGISDIKKEEIIEDINNIPKLEEKIEEIKEPLINKIDDTLNRSEKIEEIKEKNIEIDGNSNENKIIEEKINNFFCRDDILENFREEHPIMATYLALFIIMLFGYYLVK